jgi:hypothetical protein
MAGLLTSFEAVQDKIRSNVSELAINYRHSPIVEQHPNGRLGELLSSGHFHASGPHAGDRAPDGLVPLAPGGEEIRLFDLLKGTRHLLLLFVGLRAHSEATQNQREMLTKITQEFPDLLSLYFVSPNSSESKDLPKKTTEVLDVDGRLHRAYSGGDGALFLVRPDGYIGFRSQPGDLVNLRAYLSRIIS